MRSRLHHSSAKSTTIIKSQGLCQEETMKILHLADLHIGKQVNGFLLIADQRFVLEEVLTIAEQHNIDALLLAGDLYDKSSPSAEAVSLLDWFFTELAAAGLPCYAIPGNHDSAERVAYVSGLLNRQGIHLAPLFDGQITHYTVEDEYGPLTFWLLPFMKPAHVRTLFPDADIAQDYTAAIRTVLVDCPLDTSERNVLLAHQFVTSGAAEPERSDSELSIGGLDNVDASIFAAFDYVALGHIHRPQRIGRDEVRYAGSLLKYSFSEINYPKSVTLIELKSKGDNTITLIPLEPLHDMREIKGPLDSLLSDDIVSAGKADDYLHVVLTDEEPAIDSLARVRAVYPNAMAVDYDNTRTRFQSSTPKNAPDVSQTDPLVLFEQFYLKQNGEELSDEQKKVAHKAFDRAQADSQEEALR